MTWDEIVETFDAIDDGEERLRFLIELGKGVPGLPEEAKTEGHRVHGCQSRVWMLAGFGDDGHLVLRADSDAIIVRGLIAILLAIFDGHTREEVLAADASALFQRIGLEAHLTIGRRNGLHAMVQRIRSYAA